MPRHAPFRDSPPPPPFQLVTGPWNRLEALFQQQVVSWRHRAPFSPLLVFVPHALLAERLEQRLTTDMGSVLNVMVAPPEPLLARLNLARSKGVGRVGLRQWVIQAIETTAGPGTYFAPLKDHPLLPDMFTRLVQDCMSSGATPDHFRAAAGFLDPQRTRKLLDLARFLEQWHQIVQSRGQDRESAPHAPLGGDHPAGWDPVTREQEAVMTALSQTAGTVFYGFDAPPQAIVPVLKALAGARIPTVVYAPQRAEWVRDPDADDRSRRWFQPDATTHAVDARRASNPTLRHLEAFLFAPPERQTRADPDPAALQVISAPDPATEIRVVIRDILELNRGGVPFDRMLVTFRRADDYATVVGELFDEHGVPFLSTFAEPLVRLPVVRAIRLILALIRENPPAEETLELLTNPWFTPRAYLPSQTPAPDVFAWDKWARHAGLRFDDGRWRRRLEAWLELNDPDDLPGDRTDLGDPDAPRAQIDTFDAVLSGLTADLAAFPERAPASAYRTQVAALVQKLIVPPASPAPSEVDGRAHFLQVLEETVELDRVVPSLEWKDYRAHLDAACADRTVVVPAGTGHGVRIAALPDIAGIDADHVFVSGMVASLFPAPDPQDPILSNGERAAIARAGADFVVHDPGLGEKRLFLDAITAAGQRLVLTYHRADSNGREQLPSPFIREVWRAFFGNRIFDRDFRAHRRFVREVRHDVTATGNWARRWELRLIRDARARGANDLAPRRLAAWLNQSPELAGAFRAERDRWNAPAFGPFDGVIGPSWRGPSKVLQASASQLERIASCPFLYLASHVWRLAPLPPRGGERAITALARGRLYHDLLEALVRREKTKRTDRLPADAPPRDTMAAFIDEALDAFEQTHGTGHPALWAAERTQILHDVLEIMRRILLPTNDFRPYDVEIPFGRSARDGAPPLEVFVRDVGRIEISGRIDRIDVDPARKTAQVIDYKTGKAPGRSALLKSVASGRRLQPILYLDAARAFIPKGYEVAAFCYDYVTERAGGFKRWELPASELESIEEETQEALSVIGTLLRDGAFFPWPNGACRYCDFGLLCRRSPLARFERKRDDPRVKSFVALRR